MTKERSELKSIGYEIFIGILSLLSIVNLLLLYAIQEEALETVLEAMNSIFSVIFLADFLYRILTAQSAAAYFFKHFGWADLLASVPLAQFKFLRVFRLIRVYRLLRGVGILTIGRALSKDRAGSSLYILLLMGIFVLEFGSLAMLRVEQAAPGANITTASDAIWYTIVTISTVGYGDKYPVTDAGRVIGAGIIVVGVGIFGTFTGYLANFFLSPEKKNPAPPVDASDSSSATVEGLRLRLEESEAKLTEIRKLLVEPT
ncbi:pH-gated potassium channel KcsA [Arthrobacter sp. SO5]|uniref:ion transporter n=1 Tax=Arthrobacter sp. SO5 TaxID=1897055 RepID=UPI001E386015|nr:ion transporter [Arthrobacter sp. SO5]MCB5275359.1 pH-gated potassium channel KcsA [Arthrobacter sp. SO5]